MHALGDILDQSNKRQLSSGHGVNQLARRNIDIKTCQRSSSGELVAVMASYATYMLLILRKLT